MTRSIASATQTKLAANQIFVADLIELQLSTAQYLTTTNLDITYDSLTAPDAGNSRWGGAGNGRTASVAGAAGERTGTAAR